MHDWVRSLSVLAIGFVGVLALTLGLAELIVTVPSGTAAAGGTGGPSAVVAEDPGRLSDATSGIGGTLAVSGVREGAFRLTRERFEGRYSLVGDDGRISFAGEPVEVVQISYDGLELFPDPGDCQLTAVDLDPLVGIGSAELRCDDVADARGNGLISLAGTLRLPIGVIGRHALPPSGGSVAVGEQTWTFPDALLHTRNPPIQAGTNAANMFLVDAARNAALAFTYDAGTHRLALDQVLASATVASVPEGACAFERTGLGRTSPRTEVVELAIDCPAIDVPSLGMVPISGTIVVEEIEGTAP